MKNSTLYIANRKKIVERFIKLIIFITIVLTIYHSIRFYLNPSYELSNASIIGYLTALIWITLTEKSVRKLEFENEKAELIITKKSFFGKEKNIVVKYSKLEYEIKNLNQFWALLYGKKNLILKNDSIELENMRSTEEYNAEEIEKIEKTLIEIKNASW